MRRPSLAPLVPEAIRPAGDGPRAGDGMTRGIPTWAAAGLVLTALLAGCTAAPRDDAGGTAATAEGSGDDAARFGAAMQEVSRISGRVAEAGSPAERVQAYGEELPKVRAAQRSLGEAAPSPGWAGTHENMTLLLEAMARQFEAGRDCHDGEAARCQEEVQYLQVQGLLVERLRAAGPG